MDTDNPAPERRDTASLPLPKKLLFTTIMLVVPVGLLVALELVARVAAPYLLGKPFDSTSARASMAEYGFIVDPVLGWVSPPGDFLNRGGPLFHTNSAGLYSPEFSQEKPSGALRVLAIGDSTVMGWGVEQRDVFTQILQRQLDERLDRPVEVINAGHPGYSSEQARIYLETRGLALQPDVVVFQTSHNDRRAIAPGFEPDSIELFQSTSDRMRLFELTNRSAITQVLRRLLSRDNLAYLRSGKLDFSEVAVDLPPRVSLDRYQENVRRIISLTRDAGGEVILIALQDNPETFKEILHARELMQEGNWKQAERELGLPLLRPFEMLLAQKLLNEVLAQQGRDDEISATVPAWSAPQKDMSGYTIAFPSEPYLNALRQVGAELGVPVVFPRSPDEDEPGAIYTDWVHLNALGHEILAAELFRALKWDDLEPTSPAG